MILELVLKKSLTYNIIKTNFYGLRTEIPRLAS